ncbi:mannosyl-oligosaccharide alpha-1,2-mannosidase [Mortierella claussenii]|nr:mannosyl-oligosaccharide alpha-1,2-mannosidase [Mortierella claussenii]
MFSRRKYSSSGIPFHDDNKYAKTPIGIYNKKKTHVRLRKRHAVLVLCLMAATYMFLKSPSGSASWTSSRTGSSSVFAHDKAADRKAVPAPAQPTVPVQPPPPAAGAVAPPKSDEEIRKQQQEKKKRKKKKAPPTLFELDSDAVIQKPKPNGNVQKQNRPSAPVSAPKRPVVPAVPVVPVVKPQHDWSEEQPSESKQELLDSEDRDTTEEDANFDRKESDPTRSNINGNYHGQQQQQQPSASQHTRPKVNPPLWEARKIKVKEAFLHAWNAYKRDAWGKDEYHPISNYGSNMVRKGQGFTIVDSLDTILLMGLEAEFQEAKDWVRDELDFDQDGEVNLFETTIRVLGGLLSAYHQSNHEPVFLDKAVDLADRLMGAFETTSGIPYASVHLNERRGVPSHDRGISSTSEVATLQLEFKYLTYLTGDDKYWKAAENVVLKMRDLESLDGLVPIYINPYTGHFQGGEIRLGSRGDSYYEYLIKQYLQTGKQEKVYKDMYDNAIGGVKKHLLGRTIPHNLLFVGEISKYEPSNLSPKMDHLVCFLGGTMALASTDGHALDDENPAFSRSHFSTLQEEDFRIGEELTKSCYEMYRQTETGLAPEIVYWVQKEEQIRGKTALQHASGSDFIINDRDGHNWLRPETVESLFYLWRLTGDEKYRNWGWSIFESMEKYSKVASGGYSSIHDIRRKDNLVFSDKMETFFLAETLKYFYLLFGSDDVLPLDKYVFNTEAHPLPVFSPSKELLARTANLATKDISHDASDVVSENQKEKESGSTKGQTENDRQYEDMVNQEDESDDVTDVDDDKEEMMDGGIRIEGAEDDDAGTDDSLSFLNNDDTHAGRLDVSDSEVDLADHKDGIDQGLEDLAIEDDGPEDDQDEEVQEVEVGYEESGGEGEEGENDAEEEEEEEDEEEDAGNDIDSEDSAEDKDLDDQGEDEDRDLL